MIYPSSLLCTPPSVVKEFNSLAFNFSWNGKDKVTRRSAYAPYNSGSLKMIDYENMIKAIRLSWLKGIMDVECSSFWKLYLDYLLSKQRGLFILKCNYVNQMNIPSTF